MSRIGSNVSEVSTAMVLGTSTSMSSNKHCLLLVIVSQTLPSECFSRNTTKMVRLVDQKDARWVFWCLTFLREYIGLASKLKLQTYPATTDLLVQTDSIWLKPCANNLLLPLPRQSSWSMKSLNHGQYVYYFCLFWCLMVSLSCMQVGE